MIGAVQSGNCRTKKPESPRAWVARFDLAALSCRAAAGDFTEAMT